MGLSTFIEINNDFAEEIGKDPAKFVGLILMYLHSGEYKEKIPAVRKIMTLHRADKQCQKIQKLLTPAKDAKCMK